MPGFVVQRLSHKIHARQNPGRHLLHSPGPTPLPDEVLHALMRQPMDMGDPRLDTTIAACEAGLRELLCTDAADVFFYTCNGHGAWEACIVNLLPPGAAVLIPGTGHFSESWAVQAEALGRRVVRTPWFEGLPIDPAVVEAALRADTARDIAAVFVVHTDTSSGITSNLAALGLIRQEGLPQVLARHPLLMQLVHAAVEGWAEAGALGFFGRLPHSRSSAVTTITVPAGTDVDALLEVAREDFQAAFAGALGPLQGRGFRIGHLGACHGGAGTMLGALAQGVPLLLLPVAADQFRNARALRAVGAGITLETEAQTLRSMRQALQRLFDEPPFAEAAACMADEIAAMPQAESVACAVAT